MKYQKAITFSYDDGIESDRKLVEILNRYGMKCTFNLNTGIQSRESCFEIEGKEICRMDQETIGDLYAVLLGSGVAADHAWPSISSSSS